MPFLRDRVLRQSICFITAAMCRAPWNSGACGIRIKRGHDEMENIRMRRSRGRTLGTRKASWMSVTDG